MALGIAARIKAPAIRLILNLADDLGSGRLGPRTVRIDVVDDDIRLEARHHALRARQPGERADVVREVDLTAICGREAEARLRALPAVSGANASPSRR